MPRITVATWFTFLRFALIPFFAAASIRGAYGWALLFFAAASVTDGVDGFIARFFNQRSRLGAMLDPLADKSLLIGGFLLLTFVPGVPHPIPYWVTLPALARDLLIVVGVSILTWRQHAVEYDPIWMSKCNTVAQILALTCALWINWRLGGEPLPHNWAVWQTIAFALVVALVAISMAGYFRVWLAVLRGRRIADS